MPADLRPDAETFRRACRASPALADLVHGTALERLIRFGALLHHHSARRSLVAERDRSKLYTRHILDSLSAAPLFPVPPGTLLDVGSGAGFPGIPLAIVWPACLVWLVESRGRKAGFLELAARELSLTNVRVVCGRIEEVARVWNSDPLDAITIRAVGDVPGILAAVRPACRSGARWVQFAGARLNATARLAELARSGFPGEEGAGSEGGRFLHGIIQTSS